MRGSSSRALRYSVRSMKGTRAERRSWSWGPSVVAAADASPGLLERLADALDFIREKAGELQESERVEVGQLLLGQLHMHTSGGGPL